MKPDLCPEKFKHYEEVVSYFEAKFYREKDWLDCYDKLIRIDKYTEEGILYVVKHFRNEDNWWRITGNFRTLLKLRMPDKEKIKYMAVFVDKIKAEHKEKQKRKGFPVGYIIQKDDGKKRNY